MVKWFVILLLAGIVIFFYVNYHQSDAMKAYLHFDQMRREGKCGELLGMTQGEANAWAQKFCEYQSSGDALTGLAALSSGGPEAANQSAGAAAGINTLQEASMVSFIHRRQSETEAADGSVDLVVITFPITTSDDPNAKKMLSGQHEHTVKMLKQGDKYLILKFQDRQVADK